jgi:hypothetical protein
MDLWAPTAVCLTDMLLPPGCTSNVYFASKRFVQWADPINFSAKLAAIVLSGGSLTQEMLEEAINELRAEFNAVYAWLEGMVATTSQNALECLAGHLLESMIKAMVLGQEMPPQHCLPDVTIHFVPDTVTYTTATEMKVGEGVSEALPDLQVPHQAFYIVWESNESIVSLQERLEAFDGQLSQDGVRSAAQRFFAYKLREILSQVVGDDIANRVQEVMELREVSQSQSLENALTQQLLDALNLSAADLGKKLALDPKNPIIQLSLDDFPDNQKVKMKDFFAPLLLGNAGEVGEITLEINLSTYSLSAEVPLHHKHSWGSARELGQQGIQAIEQAGIAVVDGVNTIAQQTWEVVAVDGPNQLQQDLQNGFDYIGKRLRMDKAFEDLTKAISDGLDLSVPKEKLVSVIHNGEKAVVQTVDNIAQEAQKACDTDPTHMCQAAGEAIQDTKKCISEGVACAQQVAENIANILPSAPPAASAISKIISKPRCEGFFCLTTTGLEVRQEAKLLQAGHILGGIYRRVLGRDIDTYIALEPLVREARFRAIHDWAVQHGYVGGVPNFHQADYGEGVVYGALLLRSGAADWRDLLLSELRGVNPPRCYDAQGLPTVSACNGYETYITMLAKGKTIAEVHRAIANSQEARHTVLALYSEVYGMEPDMISGSADRAFIDDLVDRLGTGNLPPPGFYLVPPQNIYDIRCDLECIREQIVQRVQAHDRIGTIYHDMSGQTLSDGKKNQYLEGLRTLTVRPNLEGNRRLR